ncbi:hypothetical protein U1Q18_048008 [Sarracenia purpurea var. burkii]
MISKAIRSKLSQQSIDAMSKEITEEEVQSVLWSLPANKAPGPDGYSAGFFKSAWDIVVCLALAAMSEGPQLVLGMPIWFAILLDFIKGATDSELSLILEACLYADVLGFSNGAAYFLVKVLLLSELLSHLLFGSSSLGLWFYAMVFLHLVQCC